MHKLSIFLIVALSVVFTVSCNPPRESKPTQPVSDKPAETEAECLLRGGEWKVASVFAEKYACFIKMQDAGKSCTDSSQCMGKCLATERSAPPVTGVCSDSNIRLGCYSEVINGKLGSRVCVD